jgi:purine-cytosine permease-like protein
VPWLGVVLFDFYYSKKIPSEKNNKEGWIGLASFLFGIAFSVPFMNSSLYVGYIASKYFNGADISYLISLIVSVLIYIILIKLRGNKEQFTKSVELQ